MRTIDSIHLDAKHKLEDLTVILDALRARQSSTPKNNVQLDKDIYSILNELNYSRHLIAIIEEHLL